MPKRVAVLMATDEQYAAPMQVAITSILDHLSADAVLDVYVMAPTVRQQTRLRLEGFKHDRLQLHWVPIDQHKLEPYRGHGYPTSPAAMFRLLAGSSLPDLSKVIYLDVDILVRKDLLPLWEQAMQGCVALAVQDCYLQEFLASLPPPNSHAQSPEPYFNSGVMVIDLTAWRAEQIELRCREEAARFPRGTKWFDQHLLNICLAGRWGRMPPVWNLQYCVNLLPDWRCSPYGQDEFAQARRDPAIVHFCSRTKPWDTFCDHPPDYVRAYRSVQRRIGIPEPSPATAVQRVWELFARPHRRVLDLMATANRVRRRRNAFRLMVPRLVGDALRHPWTLVTVPCSVLREWLSTRLRRLGDWGATRGVV